MSASKPTLCFTCGLAVGEPPVLNALPGGETCPTCAARVLEGIPAALPGLPHAIEQGDPPEEAETVWLESPFLKGEVGE